LGIVLFTLILTQLFFLCFVLVCVNAFIKEMLNVAMCQLKKQRKFPHQIMVVVEKVLVVGRVQ